MTIYTVTSKQQQKMDKALSELFQIETQHPSVFEDYHSETVPHTRGGMIGLKHSDATRQLLSELATGRSWNQERRDEYAARRTGEKRSPEARAIFSTAQKKAKKGKPFLANSQQRTCPHCGTVGNPGNIGRYHGDNCKHKQ